jgi:hypothetical protein
VFDTTNREGDAMTLTIQQRFDRLDELIAEDRVIRGEWRTKADDGRERLCLLAALSPEVAEAEDAFACPATLLPDWLAELTPRIDDHTSDANWPKVIREFARAARLGAMHLDDKGWERVRLNVLLAAVRIARRHGAAEACTLVERLLEFIREGGNSTQRGEAWAEARKAALAAEAVGEVAGHEATVEAASAALSALAATAAITSGCRSITDTGFAVGSATRAAREGARSRGDAHEQTTRAAAWDEIAFTLFAAIDEAVQRAGASS